MSTAKTSKSSVKSRWVAQPTSTTTGIRKTAIWMEEPSATAIDRSILFFTATNTACIQGRLSWVGIGKSGRSMRAICRCKTQRQNRCRKRQVLVGKVAEVQARLQYTGWLAAPS
jgi:hypothetical protein